MSNPWGPPPAAASRPVDPTWQAAPHPLGGPPSAPWAPPQAPAPRPRSRRSPVAWILNLVLLALALGLAAMIILANLPPTSAFAEGERKRESQYQNDDYVAPAPDRHPPATRVPDNLADAKQLLTDNPLYKQAVPSPIRCGMATVDVRTTPKATLDRHFTELSACLMKAWAGPLKAAGFTAVRPTITLYNQTISTPCGAGDPENAFYCELDQQIYISKDLFETMPPKVASSRFIVDLVLAHEFGHAIQARVGILAAESLVSDGLSSSQATVMSRRAELQADCLAGLFYRSLTTSLALTPADKVELSAAWKYFGDDSGGDQGEGDHGRGQSREHWGLLGLNADPPLIGVCNTWTAPENQVR